MGDLNQEESLNEGNLSEGIIEDTANEVNDAAEDSINNLKKQNEDLIDRVHRNMAEFDNFRKRTAKEKASMYDDGVKDTIEKILPVIDNFERAIATLQSVDENISKGILMIYKQLENTLLDIGVETITSKGATFDPNLHFAVSHEDDANYGENEIIEEMQKGYKYKDKVIRCSMVKVAN